MREKWKKGKEEKGVRREKDRNSSPNKKMLSEEEKRTDGNESMEKGRLIQV